MNDDLINTILGADILQLAGLDNASPEAKDRALSEAKNLILSAVIGRIRNGLAPEIREKFERLFGTEDDALTEEDTAFLKEHVPDLDALVLEQTLAFKKGVMDAAEETGRKAADESQKINGILNELKE